MKSTEYEGGDLRLILAGMITDTKVCGRIIAAMDKPAGPRFESPLARIVVNWCREHWNKYGQVLNGTASQYFKKWAETSKDAGTITQLERLLEYVSEEYTTSSFAENSNYVLDVATAYFKTQEARSRIEDAQDYLSDGKVDEALQQLSSINQIQLGYSAVFDPFKDIDVWIDRFAEDGVKPLFEYPGDLGELIGDVFTKGSLVGIQGVDKVGKSFFLLDAAWRALKNRKRVAYFEVGDLGQDEMIRRLWQRIAVEPAVAGHVQWPDGWDANESDKPTFTKRLKGGLSLGRAVQLANRYVRKRHLFKLSCYPNSSISTVDIEGYLSQWAKESGWLPDLCVIDYADILAPANSRQDLNEQIDQTWKHLRRISQTFDCVVLTATQSGAQAYRTKSSVLTRKDFQGRRTKFAEVNSMLGLMASGKDQANGIVRVNQIVRRNAAYSEYKHVVVAGCLSCCTPIVQSRWSEYKPRAVKNDSED